MQNNNVFTTTILILSYNSLTNDVGNNGLLKKQTRFVVHVIIPHKSYLRHRTKFTVINEYNIIEMFTSANSVVNNDLQSFINYVLIS